jgi:hypothetical protein
VFAHITIPHPPFLFGANGEMPAQSVLSKQTLSKSEYLAHFADQVTYTNKMTRRMVEDILAKSDVPPIIILQADHGPGYMAPGTDKSKADQEYTTEESGESAMHTRRAILSAYYLPDGGDRLLYDSISPVNTFRVILDKYFKMKLDVLEDESYETTWSGRSLEFSGFERITD